MKKVIFLLAVGVALISRADYLYWMVDETVNGTDIQGNPTTFDWSTAVLKYEENNTVMELSSEDAAIYREIDSYAVADVGSASDYSTRKYFIELYNGNKWIAQTVHTPGSNLSQYIFGSDSMASLPGVAFGQAGSTTYSVPEPTSGLLFLIGGMLLGLKRRRQQV